MPQSSQNLSPRLSAMVSPSLTLPTPESIWEWAAREVDYSRVVTYDTPLHGPYDPDYMPFWKEPMDAIRLDDVREVVVLKNSRAGYSENMCLVPLRWVMAQSPARTMYLTGDQISGERFLRERIKRGIGTSAECKAAYRGARSTEFEINMRGMDFRVSWPRAKQAFKQDGWELIFCDEVDLWPEFAADMARKRCDTYPFHTIVFGSSIDPGRRGTLESSPILSLFSQTDRREWFMPSPKTGDPFRFELGESAGKHGIRWPAKAKNADGEWDLQRVKGEAHYVTPDGQKIPECDRLAIMRQGEWKPTAQGVPGRRGYRVTQPMVAFSSGGFGEIAAAFLSAKARGAGALRTYFAEYWAQTFVADRDEVQDTALQHRVKDYGRGELLFPAQSAVDDPAARFVIMTVDVHKDWFQWVVRQWMEPGHSCLVDFGVATDFEGLERVADKHEAYRVFVDNHYALRRMEVLDYCAQVGAVPLLGDDNLTMPYRRQEIDPYEGKRGAGRSTCEQYTWNTHEFRSRLLAAMRGESRTTWAVYRGVEREYTKSVTSTELRDGAWMTKPGQSQDHIFDCEVMQFVAAAIIGLCR